MSYPYCIYSIATGEIICTGDHPMLDLLENTLPLSQALYRGHADPQTQYIKDGDLANRDPLPHSVDVHSIGQFDAVMLRDVPAGALIVSDGKELLTLPKQDDVAIQFDVSGEHTIDLVLFPYLPARHTITVNQA